MTLSHQFVEQLSRPLSAAVFGNVGNLISFRVGEQDAHSLSREFGNSYNPQTLGELGNFSVVAKLLENGEHRQPFIGRTMPPIQRSHGKRERLIRRSREKYATPRRVVEGKIDRWMRRQDF
jgi:hypothetical protein